MYELLFAQNLKLMYILYPKKCIRIRESLVLVCEDLLNYRPHFSNVSFFIFLFLRKTLRYRWNATSRLRRPRLRVPAAVVWICPRGRPNTVPVRRAAGLTVTTTTTRANVPMVVAEDTITEIVTDTIWMNRRWTIRERTTSSTSNPTCSSSSSSKTPRRTWWYHASHPPKSSPSRWIPRRLSTAVALTRTTATTPRPTLRASIRPSVCLNRTTRPIRAITRTWTASSSQPPAPRSTLAWPPPWRPTRWQASTNYNIVYVLFVNKFSKNSAT